MEEIKLGCKAYELEIGTEFSFDEGYNWLIVRTEPKYVSDADDDDDDDHRLRFLSSPEESPSLGDWKETILDDWDHVLLEKNWKGN